MGIGFQFAGECTSIIGAAEPGEETGELLAAAEDRTKRPAPVFWWVQNASNRRTPPMARVRQSWVVRDWLWQVIDYEESGVVGARTLGAACGLRLQSITWR
jgi:hypothetical protein